MRESLAEDGGPEGIDVGEAGLKVKVGIETAEFATGFAAVAGVYAEGLAEVLGYDGTGGFGTHGGEDGGPGVHEGVGRTAGEMVSERVLTYGTDWDGMEGWIEG